MPNWIVPLSDIAFSAEEVEAVAETYRSGWLSQGPRVAAFEQAFAELLGARCAIAVSSGTAALQLICAAVGVGAGDEVIVPSLTFAATAAAVVHAGATPVFADVAALDRPWLSVETVAPLIRPATRAIITVSYAGHPGDASALSELARAHQVALIEDAAHALGARDGARAAGTIGDAGAFSFFANKNMALGEGGMVVTGDERIAQRARLLRSHGLTSDTWARHRGAAADYDVVEAGFNYRLDEPRAALALLLLRRLDGDNAQREAVARRYGRELASVAGVEPVVDRVGPDVRSAWHIYPLLLDPAVDRSRFRADLREAGVQTSVHYPPLHLTQAFRKAPRPASLAVTEEYAQRTVTIPLFAHISDEQQSHVLTAIKRALSRRSGFARGRR